MIERVLTIGAYGFDEQSFIRALKGAKADLFIDIRARRGVRGAAYAFANSRRLQSSLAAAGIPYTHVKDLAPSAAVRAAQFKADKQAGIAKRQRTRLGEAFIAAYERERMKDFEPKAFARNIINGSSRPVFFCVEREPEACHRSIVARRFAEAIHVPVEDLRP